MKRNEEKSKTKSKTKNLLANLALLCITLIVCLLALEFLFRILLGTNLSYEYEGELWMLKPEQSGFTCPNTKLATINEHAIRGSYSEDESSILFLGDSFVFGYCIGDNDTLTENLRRLYSGGVCNLHFINLGVPGYGVKDMIALYETKYTNHPARTVVLALIEADLFRQSADDDPKYAQRMFFRKLIRVSSFVAFMKPRLELFRQLITGEQEAYNERYRQFMMMDQERIVAFNRALKRKEKRLVLFPWQYKANQSRYYDELEKFAAANDISFIKNHFEMVFGEGELSELYAEDDHPSELQTRLVAEAIGPQLIEIGCK